MTRSFYVTTPIYYMNGEPHIGHTYTTCVADTLARYHRMCGEDVFFLTGSDEHGEKILETAEREGVAPRDVTDRYSAIFRETWTDLGLGFDRFIRTTDADHVRAVQLFLQRVHDAGQIEFREYEGQYCVGCERFVTERDLENGRCRDHDRVPERRSEANYFFRMSEHFAWLEATLRERPDWIRPERYRNEVLGMLRDAAGLGDLCISRPKSRLAWGIELPFDREYVCYVWFDALVNYLTATGWPDAPGWEARWSAAEHLIAKDILKPHGVFWPTMLHAIGLPLPRHVHVHGYWNVDEQKVAKSLGNAISPRAMDEKYGFEAFRYVLLREMSYGLDASFSEDVLVARINADLANNLGNFASRTLHMTARFAEGRVPTPGPAAAPERELEAAFADAARAVDEHLRATEPHRALEAVQRALDAGNRYLEQREPWKAAKDAARADEVRTTLYTACEALRIATLLLAPFVPRKAAELWHRLGQEGSPEDARLPAATRWGGLAPGAATTKGEPLFPRVEPAPSDAAKPAPRS
ncbi:MAG: methionine--tRNA ligase [Myxococcota bacterium]|nr:methionine--tRNA ligase [Myxococcales bacterium]